MVALSLPDPPKIRGTNFRLQRIQAMNPLRGGNHQAVDMGEPVWMCDLETTPLSRAQGGSWKWLLAKLRGALRTLYLHDASRRRPLAYLHTDDNADALIGVTARKIGLSTRRIGATDAPWGEPRITAISRTNATLTLAGFTAGAVVSEGDYGHWDDGPTRRLHILGAGTADASGVMTVEVEPAPPASAYLPSTLPAPFTMEQASAEMAVMSASAPFSAPVTHEATLTAVQVLRRS